MIPFVRLGDAALVIAGQSPDGSSLNAQGMGLPFYQGKKEFGERHIGPPTTWTTEVTKVANEGDILMSVRAPVGPINISTQRICIGRGLSAIHCNRGLDRDFLFYQLLFKRPEIAGKEGAVFASISKTDIEAIRLWVPKLEEQRRIVAILDEAFEGIATAKSHAERNLRNSREVFEGEQDACFREGASGESRQVYLAEVATFRNGINYTKRSRGQEVPIVGVKDFQSNFWAPMDCLDRVTLDGALDEVDQVAGGDIVFVRSNGNPELIGRCVLVRAVSEPTAHSGFTIKMRLIDASLLPVYVCHFLKSRTVRRQLVEGGNGANIRSLNQGTLSAVKVPVPAVQVQCRVVSRLEKLAAQSDRLEDLYQRKLAALDELKQSLLHQAFNGRL